MVLFVTFVRLTYLKQWVFNPFLTILVLIFVKSTYIAIGWPLGNAASCCRSGWCKLMAICGRCWLCRSCSSRHTRSSWAPCSCCVGHRGHHRRGGAAPRGGAGGGAAHIGGVAAAAARAAAADCLIEIYWWAAAFRGRGRVLDWRVPSLKIFTIKRKLHWLIGLDWFRVGFGLASVVLLLCWWDWLRLRVGSPKNNGWADSGLPLRLRNTWK